jgi:hypothetical protein
MCPLCTAKPKNSGILSFVEICGWKPARHELTIKRPLERPCTYISYVLGKSHKLLSHVFHHHNAIIFSTTSPSHNCNLPPRLRCLVFGTRGLKPRFCIKLFNYWNPIQLKILVYWTGQNFVTKFPSLKIRERNSAIHFHNKSLGSKGQMLTPSFFDSCFGYFSNEDLTNIFGPMYGVRFPPWQT